MIGPKKVDDFLWPYFNLNGSHSAHITLDNGVKIAHMHELPAFKEWLDVVVCNMIKECPDYLYSLLGEREEGGSRWGTDLLLNHILNFEWTALESTSDHDEDSLIKVFQAEIKGTYFNPTQRITYVCELDEEERETVDVSRGPHGNLELVMPALMNEQVRQEAGVEGYPTNIATMIIGPWARDTEPDLDAVIYTIYPGSYSAKLPEYDSPKDLMTAFQRGDIPDDCAVKWIG